MCHTDLSQTLWIIELICTVFFQAEYCIRYLNVRVIMTCFFFFQAEDGIRDLTVTGVQTCALPICGRDDRASVGGRGRPARREARARPRAAPPGLRGREAHALVPRGARHRERARRSEERRVGKECRSRWSPYH